MEKCSTCNQPSKPDCDFNQGRCPHRKPIMTMNRLKRIVAYIIVFLCASNIYFYWSSSDTVYAWLVAFIGWLDVATGKE